VYVFFTAVLTVNYCYVSRY